MRLIFAIMFAALTFSPISAEEQASGTSTDSRIRVYDYHNDQVYRLDGYTGYDTTIVLDPSEVIIHATSGDSDSWKFTLHPRGNSFSLYPKVNQAQPSSMTVHTNRRMYTFLLVSHRGTSPSNVGFRYSFNYPDTRRNNNRSPQNIFDVFHKATYANIQYSASGSEQLRPAQAFDDGRKTYIRLNQQIRPAVFTVGPDGRERLVNTTDLPDGTIVVTGVHAQLVLRGGAYVACLFNTSAVKE